VYTWMKYVHLLGLVLLASGNAIELVAYSGLRRATTVGELRTWQKLPKEAVTGGGMLLLIITGLAMAGQSWSFTDGWILAAILLLVAAIVTGGAGISPRMGRLKKALADAGPADTPVSPELSALARNPVMHGIMRGQVVAVAEFVFLMVVKPSAAGILISLLVMAIVIAAVCWPLIRGGAPAPDQGPSPAA
jgi:hypothetical protein